MRATTRGSRDALLSIARRDAANRWIRAAVLSSCAATAHRLFVDLWTDPVSPIPAAQAELLEQLAEIVGARNRPDEIGRVLDHAGVEAVADASSRSSCETAWSSALARGLRRSGGQLPVDQVPARSGAGLVAHLVQRARTKALDGRVPEPVRVEAIDMLSTLDPDESRVLLLDLLEPRQPLAVQIAAVRALVGSHSADLAGDFAAPAARIRAGGPHGRGPDTLDPCGAGPRPCSRPSAGTTRRLESPPR